MASLKAIQSCDLLYKCKVFRASRFVSEILKCERSNESYQAAHSVVLFILTVHTSSVVLTFESVNEKVNASEQYSPLLFFIMLTRLSLESAEKILKYDLTV